MVLVCEAEAAVCEVPVAEEPVVREAEFVVAGAEEELSAVAVSDDSAVLDSEEAPVVAVEDESSLVAVADSVALDEFSLQTTLSGVETPAEEQICLAYLTAAAWPSLSHAEVRQQAMPLRKSAFLQMQAMSSCPQPAMDVPVVYLVTQPVAQSGIWAAARPDRKTSERTEAFILGG